MDACTFLAGSHALQADVGDGLISFLGLIVLGWPIVWRARAAFLQGMFLGLLSLDVLVATAYRVLVLNQPEAEMMGRSE